MNQAKVKGEPLRILLIEDNPGHADLVKRTLQNHRIANKIFTVSDGEQALNYLRRCGEFEDPQTSPRPHVILLDLRLPKIDGQEVLKTIKTNEALKSIPVVILTTSKTEQDITMAYMNYANSYLVKPVDFEKFNQMMSDLGFYWLSWNQNPWT
jgi:CheY-like chemotaxis protein